MGGLVVQQAYAKAAIAAGAKLPASGNVFITMVDKHKSEVVDIAKQLIGMGYGIIATSGTYSSLCTYMFVNMNQCPLRIDND